MRAKTSFGAVAAVGVVVALLPTFGNAGPVRSSAGGRSSVAAAPSWLFAYAGGQARSPLDCPRTADPAHQCRLSQALARARPGSTVGLATPGSQATYVGNWVILSPGTTASAPVTIRPAPGAQGPVLGGNGGHKSGCGTASCAGPVLTVGPRVHLDLTGLTIRNADNTRNGLGGAIQNNQAGVVTIKQCDFYHDFSNADGGAIDNADVGGQGTLSVISSIFKGNFAVNSDGGAIANADLGGRGRLTISGSTFDSNSAINGDGGAIDNGDTRGRASAVVSTSLFLGNVAGRAGAIDNADNGDASLRVSSSTFTGNVAALDDGGAIDNADWGGHGTVRVRQSTFSGNKTIGSGGAIDNADSMATSRGTVYISVSTFSTNTADVHGGALDNADIGRGTLAVWSSTFAGNSANNIYGPSGSRGGGSINNGPHGEVALAADILDAPCRGSKVRWQDVGYNVGSNRSCLRHGDGDVPRGAGRLSALADHGGPTQTLLPLAGNPAVGAVPSHTTVRLAAMTLTLCPTTDQRGTPSGPGRRCNSGSVQSP